jgi:hypothetical protein
MARPNEESSSHASSLTLVASDFSIAGRRSNGLFMLVKNGFVNKLFNRIEKSAQLFHTGLKQDAQLELCSIRGD